MVLAGGESGGQVREKAADGTILKYNYNPAISGVIRTSSGPAMAGPRGGGGGGGAGAGAGTAGAAGAAAAGSYRESAAAAGVGVAPTPALCTKRSAVVAVLRYGCARCCRGHSGLSHAPSSVLKCVCLPLGAGACGCPLQTRRRCVPRATRSCARRWRPRRRLTATTTARLATATLARASACAASPRARCATQRCLWSGTVGCAFVRPVTVGPPLLYCVLRPALSLAAPSLPAPTPAPLRCKHASSHPLLSPNMNGTSTPAPVCREIVYRLPLP